jgi:NAD(P)-dependent dehydrogenase (short-subunit alcohol dehydrogenase family)
LCRRVPQVRSSYFSCFIFSVRTYRKEKLLHVLFNNALVHYHVLVRILFTVNKYSGVMESPIEQVTAQGYDMQFGTNAIGTTLLIAYKDANITFCLYRALVPYRSTDACTACCSRRRYERESTHHYHSVSGCLYRHNSLGHH